YAAAKSPSVVKLVGNSWVTVGGGISGRGYDLHAWDDGAGTQLYVGGAFVHAGAQHADRIAKLSNGAWEPVSTSAGRGNAIDALAVHDDGSGPALYADTSGYSEFVNSSDVLDGVARWDGASWTQLGGASNGDVLVLRSYAGSLFAGGEFAAI